MSGLGLELAAGATEATFLLTRAGLDFVRSRISDPPEFPAFGDPWRVTRYTDQALEALRTVTDGRTDSLIREIARTGGQAAGVAAQSQVRREDAEWKAVDDFRGLLMKGRTLTLRAFRDQPYFEALKRWDELVVRMPRNVDRMRLQRAAEFFRPRLFPIGVILSTSSLLEAYACRKGVDVLARTGELSKHTNRRLSQTLQFLMDVNAREGFGRAKRATPAIKKVRLLHGAIRFLVRNSKRHPYDEAANGAPINEEDLLGTLMAFSGIVIRDLPKLGISVTAEEAEDHRYLWDVVGQMLGIKTALRPRNITESFALIMAIERRQQAASHNGIRMATALLRYHRSFIGRELLDSLGLWIIRRLAGDRVCDMLNVPLGDWYGAFLFKDLAGDASSAWGGYLLGHDGMTAGDTWVPAYSIPPSLRSAWGSPRQGVGPRSKRPRP